MRGASAQRSRRRELEAVRPANTCVEQSGREETAVQKQGIRMFALVGLIIALLGVAYAIEENARPDTGRRGQRVGGETSGGPTQSQ